MATPIDTNNVQDFDTPLNKTPNYSATHIFSTADITGTFSGQTQGDVGASFIDFSGANGTQTTKDGVILYPIDSEFGFNVTDFVGTTEKAIDGAFTEGWAGDLLVGGVQAGLVMSTASVDAFATPALFGTWLTDAGGKDVKASSEQYSVMQQTLSDQKYPGDPAATNPLDDDLILLSLNPAYNGQHVDELLTGTASYGGAPVVVRDVNLDGVVDILDLMKPNEASVQYDIAYSSDYSVTMKDDGKLLYRWGDSVKRPSDVRFQAEIQLPTEWDAIDSATSLNPLYRITAAELIVHHTITSSPNDQIRPEDFENESAIGTLPSYQVVQDYNGDTGRTVWVSTNDYYAGDGTLYPAGTILRDSDIADATAGSLPHQIGSMSEDLELGFTSAWYTTMDREPFEPVFSADGLSYIRGPRWRLQPEKYGQDLPGLVIPIDPSVPLPTAPENVKYTVGAETQTVINLLDWNTPISPLEISAGWHNNSGLVSVNGVNMTRNFDIGFYVKGESNPATVFSAELVMNYEPITLHAAGSTITGTSGSDHLVGIGNNTFTGGTGSDLFVLSYGTSESDVITQSTVTDYEVGVDKIGLIGIAALSGFNIDDPASRSLISQGVSGNDLTISIAGTQIATLTGLAASLGVGTTVDAGEGLSIAGNFLITNPVPAPVINGTPVGESLTGTPQDDIISGLAGNDYLYGMDGDDILDGGAGLDRLQGGQGADDFVFATGSGLDIIYDFVDGVDEIQLKGIDTADITISDHRTTGTLISAGTDYLILREVDHTTITLADFIEDPVLAMA